MERITKHGQKARKYESRRPSAVLGAVKRNEEIVGKSEDSPVANDNHVHMARRG